MIFKANYLGGHPARQKPKDGVYVYVDNDGVKVKHGYGELFKVPWSRISELAVDGPDEIRRRFTATRLVLFFPAGLAWKKKVKQEFYVVVGGPWGQCAFQTKAKSRYALQAQLAPWTHRVNAASAQPSVASPPAPAPRTATVDSLADELERLTDLHGRGALTTEEFEAAKARALRPG